MKVKKPSGRVVLCTCINCLQWLMNPIIARNFTRAAPTSSEMYTPAVQEQYRCLPSLTTAIRLSVGDQGLTGIPVAKWFERLSHDTDVCLWLMLLLDRVSESQAYSLSQRYHLRFNLSIGSLSTGSEPEKHYYYQIMEVKYEDPINNQSLRRS